MNQEQIDAVLKNLRTWHMATVEFVWAKRYATGWVVTYTLSRDYDGKTHTTPYVSFFTSDLEQRGEFVAR